MQSKVSLDSIISAGFKRSIALENEIVRADARLDEYFSKKTQNTVSVKASIDQECKVDSSHQTTSTVVKGFNDSFSNSINTLRASMKTSAFDEVMPLYCPTLDDLDFSNHQTMDYLSGRYTYNTYEGLNSRNTYWWKNSINPLLEERASQKQNLSPVLLLYGQGHNQGKYSLLQLMSDAEFDFHLLTRRRWSEWSPKMQIMRDGCGREPGQKNYGNDLPDDLIQDSHGRFPGGLNYGNSKPDSELPDAHGREPGHKNYGNYLSDDLIQDSQGRYPCERNYGNPLSDTDLASQQKPEETNLQKKT